MLRILFPVYILLSLYINAQDLLKQQFDYAEGLFAEELYFDAVTEYKRLIFFDSSEVYLYRSNYRIAESYKGGGFYDNAVKFYNFARMNAKNAREEYKALTGIIRSNILRKTFGQAHLLLDKLGKEDKYAEWIGETSYWRGWTYLLNGDLKNASASFAIVKEDHELKNLCDNTIKDQYSVTFAKLFSYILPGSGQIYSDEYLSGLMSLGWNVLWGYLTVKAFNENRIFDGAAVGSLLWLRFYRGNIQNAEKFPTQKNIYLTNDLLIYIQQNYQGPKP